MYTYKLYITTILIINIAREIHVLNFPWAQFSQAQLVCDQMFHAPFPVLNIIVDSFLKYFYYHTNRLPKTINIIPHCKKYVFIVDSLSLTNVN